MQNCHCFSELVKKPVKMSPPYLDKIADSQEKVKTHLATKFAQLGMPENNPDSLHFSSVTSDLLTLISDQSAILSHLAGVGQHLSLMFQLDEFPRLALPLSEVL